MQNSAFTLTSNNFLVKNVKFCSFWLSCKNSKRVKCSRERIVFIGSVSWLRIIASIGSYRQFCYGKQTGQQRNLIEICIMTLWKMSHLTELLMRDHKTMGRFLNSSPITQRMWNRRKKHNEGEYSLRQRKSVIVKDELV